MDTINLFGASGHAKVVKDIIEASGNKVGFMFDDSPRCADIHGTRVYKASEVCVEGPLIVSIGSNAVRMAVANRYPVEYAKAIHPSAVVSQSASIGPGSVVMHGAIVQSDVKIGNHCIVNTGATIDHECEIGDYVHISPNATLCGNVHVGQGSWIGAGVTVIPGIKIGRWCTIGAGSVVTKNIPDNSVAVGMPCRVINHIDMQCTGNQSINNRQN